MIAVDTNVLVYAHRRDSPFHAAARGCLERLAGSVSPWAIPWPCVHEFVALVTHPRVYRPPSSVAQAGAQVDAWLGSPSLLLLSEAPDHWQRLAALLSAASAVGGMVHDARIAAICLSHGVRELWSADRDFTRFPSVAVRNPLIG